jgi:anaerobic selenocysteine-containing dehydrogenase
MPTAPALDRAETDGTHVPRRNRPGVVFKNVLCASRDASCLVVTESKGGRVVRVRSSDNPIFEDNICMKGIMAPKGFAHPDRLMRPLERVGERGSGRWEEVRRDDAMTDVAARLQAIIDRYGPEAWAVSTSQWNTSTDHGLGRRVMNHVGSPDWISGVALCAGNTAAINRTTYGWFPWPDYTNTDCIVLFGHDPRRGCGSSASARIPSTSRWRRTKSSRSPPTFRSTSATPRARGSAEPTRTRIDCSASTSRRARTCPPGRKQS